MNASLVTSINTHSTEKPENLPTNITVTYSIWVGSNVSEKYSLNITAEQNETFYNIMQRAAEMDNKYTYENFNS